ncbi:MAG: hypothetical protein SOI44_08390 [Lactimicrobium sp.]|jgi:plasmid maintenance system antidote protein VapI|uniref:hypothetical protein n=1 Tax=Lactimicrobium sp. TaxID=2563780 RepID=UPI002F3534B3
MSQKVEWPAVGTILREEFMMPLRISADQLAEDLHVSITDIQGILDDHIESRVEEGTYCA